jgi:hypothetical protein
MQAAMVEEKLVQASSESPDVAVCPSCKGEVVKRSRKRRAGQVSYFYRHKRGVGVGCPQRYSLS